MRVRWWSPAASVVLAGFVIVGVWALSSGRVPAGIVCLALAAAYVPVRIVRGYLAARNRRGETK